MPFLILSLVVQLALVVHIIKTGRSMSWVFIVLFFPLIGTLAYLIVELLPEFTSSRTARRARGKIANTMDPVKRLREASLNFAASDTVQNSMALARECLEHGRHSEAVELYRRCLRGVHADDPTVLMGLAHAQLGAGDAVGVVETLDRLKEKHPDHRSAEGHLLYAKAQELLGNLDAAIEEYEALITYYPGPEPACRLAALLSGRGETAKARKLYEQVLNDSKRAGKHYNSLHKEWITLAKRAAGG